MKTIIPFLLENFNDSLGNLVYPGIYLLDREIIPFLSPLPLAFLYSRRGRKIFRNMPP